MVSVVRHALFLHLHCLTPHAAHHPANKHYKLRDADFFLIDRAGTRYHNDAMGRLYVFELFSVVDCGCFGVAEDRAYLAPSFA